MRREPVLLAIGASLALGVPAGASAGDASPAPSAKPAAAKARLAAFRSCGGLIRYARRNTRRLDGPAATPPFPPPAPGIPDGGRGGAEEGAPQAQSPAAPDGSFTNVQEAGVDEPDVVKSDGSRIFAMAGDRLHSVEATSATPRVLGSLTIPGFGHELLLQGDRLLVLSHDGSFSGTEPVPPPRPAPGGRAGGGGARTATSPIGGGGRPATVIREVDVSDPAAMRVIRAQTVDGSYVSARLTGETARIVITSSPRALEQRGARLRSRRTGWMPTSVFRSRRSGRRARRVLTPCREVRRPQVFSGLEMLTVLTVDLARGLPAVDADAVMTSAETVYASASSLYVATQRYRPVPDSPDSEPPRTTTAVHRFDVSNPRSTAYRASGELPGYLLDQFSMSEHGGVLRAATTESPAWWAGARRRDSESFVTVLEERAGRLAEVGRVAGLGRGERIFAVRFIGDAGFVVTFRETDPLYALDLSAPSSPRLRGELKIRGFSAYLHPVAGGLLLGVGQDATEQGRQLGTQLSLFDVSDLDNPTRLHQASLGGESSSEVEFDHHAFLYWAPTGLAVLPVEAFGDESSGSGSFVGAIGFRVDRSSGIAEAGRATHDVGGFPAPVRRSLVIGGRLFTVSEGGVEANDLATLAEQGFAPFEPAPAGR